MWLESTNFSLSSDAAICYSIPFSTKLFNIYSLILLPPSFPLLHFAGWIHLILGHSFAESQWIVSIASWSWVPAASTPSSFWYYLVVNLLCFTATYRIPDILESYKKSIHWLFFDSRIWNGIKSLNLLSGSWFTFSGLYWKMFKVLK